MIEPQLQQRTILYSRPPLTDYQIDAFFHKKRYGLTEASTKSGKTHGAGAWLLEQATLTGRIGRSYYWVAPTYSQAKVAFRRMKRAIPEALRQVSETELTITLPNGAVMWFKSGEKPDNLFGDDVYAAVIDEASRFREEAWFAIRSTLTKTRGPVRIIGNVKGKKNWFYNMARKAESGDPDMHYSKITAYDAVKAGILTAAEVEDAKSILPEGVFGELFMAEPSDDGGNPFGIDHIRACVIPDFSSAPAVAYGIDLAKSVDWTVCIGLDRTSSVTDDFERFQKVPWPDTVERILGTVERKRALVDSTGVGDPIVEYLQRGGRGSQFEGLKFTSESKQKLMEGLALGIQKHQVKFPAGAIQIELEAFEYEYTRTGVKYSAPEGVHDDCVMALALAWKICQGAASLVPQPTMIRQGRIGLGGYRDGSRY